MLHASIRAAILAAGLCAPAFAVSDDIGRPDSLPSRTTAQDGLRDAPASSPGQAVPRGVAPGRQDQNYRTAPGYVTPGQAGANEPLRAPDSGRRWGLIVFVVAVISLGLMAFRRRKPMPPSP